MILKEVGHAGKFSESHLDSVVYFDISGIRFVRSDVGAEIFELGSSSSISWFQFWFH